MPDEREVALCIGVGTWVIVWLGIFLLLANLVFLYGKIANVGCP